MKKLSLLLLGILLSTTGNSDTSRYQGHTVNVLKKKIRHIAISNRNNPNKLFIRNILDPLVNNLIELKDSRTEDQKLGQVIGTWRSLWSDQVFGDGVDNSQVYQVVNPEGYYYNISKVDGMRGTSTAFLRGQFEDNGSYLAIEFTANSVQFGFPEPGADLNELANGVESGDIQTTSIPGPIGVTGVLMNIYVDDDFRIVSGNSISDANPRLFILERVHLRQ